MNRQFSNIILPVISGIILILAFSFGKFYIQDQNKDLSKNSGFLLSSTKPLMPFLHIIIGIVIGFLIFPARYRYEDSLNWKVWLRQFIGLGIFFLFTIRYLIKLARNIRKRLEDCGYDLPSIFYSSITRQQAQLLIGICLGILVGHFIINKNKTEFKFTKITTVTIVIIMLIFLQFFLQVMFTFGNLENYEILKDCVNIRNESSSKNEI